MCKLLLKLKKSISFFFSWGGGLLKSLPLELQFLAPKILYTSITGMFLCLTLRVMPQARINCHRPVQWMAALASFHADSCCYPSPSVGCEANNPHLQRK